MTRWRDSGGGRLSLPADAASAPATGARPHPNSRRLVRWEIVVVFAVSLGASALDAIVQFIGSVTATTALNKQQTVLNGSLAPGRPTLDLFLQLTNIAITLAPVALVCYLLVRGGESAASIGLDARQPVRDTARGVVLAAIIGGGGLGVLLAAYHLGVGLQVVPENLPAVWWRVPVLLLDAAQNGVLEEVIVLGYLLTRLEQLGWSPRWAIVCGALIRGSYHLYQGAGGFVGNAVMGLIFGYLYKRWGRLTPFVVAHTLIDIAAFVGYAGLHGHVAWLP